MKYLGENSLTHLIGKLKGYGDYNNLTNKPFTQLSGTEASPIYLRTLQTGAYIINGTCSPYEGSNVYMGANNAVTYVNWFETVTAVQIFYPPYNQVQYFEVYDDTYTTNTVALNDMATKLAGIEEKANNYSLPTASESVLGGIKVGSGLSINNGVLSAIGGGGTGNVSSDIVNSIMVVDELPETEVEGVLYLVKESVTEEETSSNLFKGSSVLLAQDGTEHSSPAKFGGITYEFSANNPVITVSGTATTNPIQYFEQNNTLYAGKTYKLSYKYISGELNLGSKDYLLNIIAVNDYANATKLTGSEKIYVEATTETRISETTFTLTEDVTQWWIGVQHRSSEVSCTNYAFEVIVEEVVE